MDIQAVARLANVFGATLSRVVNNPPKVRPETALRVRRTRLGPPSWRYLLITVPWVIGLLFSIYSSAIGNQIAGREQITIGWVRTHERANHNRYGYAFSVRGEPYTGWQIPTGEYQIGEQVRVYYDPLEPTTSSLNSFASSRDDALGPGLLCAIGIISAVLILYLLRRDYGRDDRLGAFRSPLL